MASPSQVIRFRLVERSVIESRLKSVPRKNNERVALFRKWLSESGCGDSSLSEQPLDRTLPPNVICVLPGETNEVILVGAHTDHVDSFGTGAVDNWTGASLLPALLYGLSGQERHHTFVFVGFSAEEKGLVGSAYYVNHLPPDEPARIKAMVNIDSLGLGPTEVWRSHADKRLLEAIVAIASTLNLPLSPMDVEKVGSSDSESFAKLNVPRITLHSVTQTTLPILHSTNDQLSAIKMKEYYDSYHLILAYLAYLDDYLQKKPNATPTN